MTKETSPIKQKNNQNLKKKNQRDEEWTSQEQERELKF